MSGRNKGFLNLNRFKSSKAIKRQMKYRIKTDKVDKINRTRIDGSRSCGGR
jgi:hypothetical protein